MRNGVTAVLLVAAIVAGAGAGYLVGSSHRGTITTTVIQYPVTFLGAPKGCPVIGFCINSTLVNHIGSNTSVIMSAWFRNATNGQNVTVGKDSVAYTTCAVDAARRPTTCLLLTMPAPAGGPNFEVSLTVLALDGRTVLSPTVTAIVSNPAKTA